MKEISREDKELARVIANRLKASRQVSSVTSEAPITREKIELALVKNGTIKDVGELNANRMHRIVDYCRTVLKEPIGSDSRGYWYCQEPKELEPFYEEMKSKAMTILTTMKAMREVFMTKEQVKMQFEKDPFVKMLMEQFGAEII